MFEILALLFVLVLAIIPIALLVLLIVAFVRTQRIAGLERRVRELEGRVQGTSEAMAPVVASLGEPEVAPAEATTAGLRPPLANPLANPLASPFGPPSAQTHEPRGWELTLGRSVLGWVAVVALVLATATFLKYALDNQWIGPQGQLSLILAGGMLVLALAYRHAVAGWRIFAEILFSAGLVVLYLATYGAFGFYHVISQEAGFVFLVILVIEAAALALTYEAWSVALVALLGGLATPLLIRSPHDQYLSLFAYLALLNASTLLILWRRQWPALGTVAMLGAQGLFWLWYQQFFHPEKLAWALGFQAMLWGLHLGQHMLVFAQRRRRASVEDLVRLLLGAFVGFGQVYYLLMPEYEPWLGSVAVLLAVVYAALAHLAYRLQPDDERFLLTMLTAVLGLVGMAIPLEAQANWVALGWSVMGASLWWFGLRVQRGVLRGMAAVVGILAIGRLIFVETSYGARGPFWPIFNEVALPSLGVVACLLGSVMLTWNPRRPLALGEPVLAKIAGAAGAVLLGWVLSWDVYSWFLSLASHLGDHTLVWAGQVAVSVLWAVYASVLLAVGFRAHRPIARWLALALYGFTVLKVFFVDLASVDQFYRIVALFCLALLLGGAAWAYQRARPAARTT